MLKKIEITDNEKKLQVISEHVPVSVSIFSNVSDYDNKPIFLCNDKPRKLIKQFVQTILKISLKAKFINKNAYSNIIEFLAAYVNNTQKDYEKFIEINGATNIYDDKQLKLLKSLFGCTDLLAELGILRTRAGV